MNIKTILFILSGCLLIAGCASSVSGGRSGGGAGATIYVAPLANATESENAGKAVTGLVESALMERGCSVIPAEPVPSEGADADANAAQAPLKAAMDKHAVYLVTGTVSEFHFKTDLDGNPAVGVTLRLVRVRDGKLLWQSSGSKVGVTFASLTSTAQYAVRDLVSRMPLVGDDTGGAGKNRTR